MHVLTKTDINAFFDRLSKSKERVLILDYDGTLAPFHVDRVKAFPYPGIGALLHQIMLSRNNRLIIVTGRTIDDLRKLLTDLKPLPELWGSHGFEWLTKEGRYFRSKIAPEIDKGLQTAQKLCLEYCEPHQCEMKGVSFALHWRGLEKSKQESLKQKTIELWSPLCKQYPLTILEFDGGIELRPLQCNKGNAIRAILQEVGPDAVVAYLGDDTTDEDAFAALGERGLKVLVNTKAKPTLADIQITPPEELFLFLNRWKETK